MSASNLERYLGQIHQAIEANEPPELYVDTVGYLMRTIKDAIQPAKLASEFSNGRSTEQRWGDAEIQAFGQALCGLLEKMQQPKNAIKWAAAFSYSSGGNGSNTLEPINNFVVSFAIRTMPCLPVESIEDQNFITDLLRGFPRRAKAGAEGDLPNSILSVIKGSSLPTPQKVEWALRLLKSECLSTNSAEPVRLYVAGQLPHLPIKTAEDRKLISDVFAALTKDTSRTADSSENAAQRNLSHQGWDIICKSGLPLGEQMNWAAQICMHSAKNSHTEKKMREFIAQSLSELLTKTEVNLEDLPKFVWLACQDESIYNKYNIATKLKDFVTDPNATLSERIQRGISICRDDNIENVPPTVMIPIADRTLDMLSQLVTDTSENCELVRQAAIVFSPLSRAEMEKKVNDTIMGLIHTADMPLPAKKLWAAEIQAGTHRASGLHVSLDRFINPHMSLDDFIAIGSQPLLENPRPSQLPASPGADLH